MKNEFVSRVFLFVDELLLFLFINFPKSLDLLFLICSHFIYIVIGVLREISETIIYRWEH